MKRRPILMLTMLLIIMFTIAASTYAYAAGNTVPVNKAGDGVL